jgi:UDP-glucose 4-epimerase
MQTAPQTCVVLGGEGFLGTNLCRRLLALGHHVRTFGRQGLFPTALTGVRLRHGELCNTPEVSQAIEGSDIVFHLIHSTVPQSANANIFGDAEENLLPSLALFEIVRRAGVKRLVFLSSGGTIYGRPTNVPTDESAPTEPIAAYGITKLAIEKYLTLYERLHGLDYRILRVANPFGPFQIPLKGQGLIAEVVSRALANQRIEIWGNGSVVRDFIYVEDVVDALILAMHVPGQQRIFNIGSGVGRSVRDVLGTIEQSLGKKLDIDWQAGRAVDVPVSILAIARARDILGWSPKTSFADGVARTIAWWRENADLIHRTTTQPALEPAMSDRAS